MKRLYQIQSTGNFGGVLKDLVVRYRKVTVEEIAHYDAFALGFQSLTQADQDYVAGDKESADLERICVETFLDISLGVTPYVSYGKDWYELITGRSLVTGNILTILNAPLAWWEL
jgi:hypothetical protein